MSLLTVSGSHPLLAQIPLIVSPFISLPTATTLPYTYKALPSTLPPSSTGPEEKSKYITSSGGHSAHPDDIIASCKGLQDYIKKMQDGADKGLKEWEDAIQARDLAEKRRLAPGWLDSELKVLEPSRKADGKEKEKSLLDMDASSVEAPLKDLPAQAGTGVGDELDRAFGGMGIDK